MRPGLSGHTTWAHRHPGDGRAHGSASPTAATTAPTASSFPPAPTLLPPPREPVATGTAGLPWWNDRVFYEVFVRSFYDGNGDGIGDLQGLISKLDFLNDGDPTTGSDLGVTGIWLMPVTESPSYHGYDVVDYRQIERDYGTNEDFKQLVAEAHKRGIALIVDLVLNHTSIQHPWFRDARTPGSERDAWYIWRTEKPNYRGPWNQPVWYQAGDRYYYSLFCQCMADLNYENPAVTEAMDGITRFWLQEMDVDGFRLDAMKHLIEEGQVQENTPATHAWLEGFHRFVRSIAPNALTVGEAFGTPAQELVKYTSGEVDIAFEFTLAQAMLDSVRQETQGPVSLAQAPAIRLYPQGQYAVFLTNHDQNRVMNQLGDDLAAARAAATLLLTNAGVPFIYYGEEIGMRGQKPDQNIRTPMQWDATERTGGFTTATPWEPLAPGYRERNVAAQTADPGSLLSHYRTLIRLRQDHPALRVGDFLPVDSDARPVYSFVRHSAGETLLVVVNLGQEPVSDYRLALKEGPLSGTPGATLLLGEGQPTAPTPNAAGGFDAYTPLPTLAPHSSTIIQLRP
ncbi:MAG: alpha-amylase family glycosyl hydrolase [Ardenticatenaceae bacterium]|nr:alpha-amylase family glycosyl hydrolase [Ardenticatenaceae bacterium]